MTAPPREPSIWDFKEKGNDIFITQFWPKGLVVLAGFLGAVTAAGEIERDVTRIHRPADSREVLLRRFLQERGCPVADSTSTFLAEADEHGLDWRLLPSLAFVESTCGKFARNNNLFGWANGNSRFATRRDAIHEVARSMAEDPAYFGKSLKGKLWSFNQGVEYRRMVMFVMEQISGSRNELVLAE